MQGTLAGSLSALVIPGCVVVEQIEQGVGKILVEKIPLNEEMQVSQGWKTGTSFLLSVS